MQLPSCAHAGACATLSGMRKRINTTVSGETHQRLRALALARDENIGETLDWMVGPIFHDNPRAVQLAQVLPDGETADDSGPDTTAGS